MALLGIEIPIIIGLVAVGIAILERGYKTFLQKKEVDPKLQFNGAYLLNILISGGVMVTVVTAIIPVVISELGGSSADPVTLGSAILNFIVGYAATYRILDGLNDSTKNKIELEEAKQ